MGISFNNLHSQIDEAGRLIAPLWPLSMSVAMNPLSGLVNLAFDEAVNEAGRWLQLRTPASSQTPPSVEQAGLTEW